MGKGCEFWRREFFPDRVWCAWRDAVKNSFLTNLRDNAFWLWAHDMFGRMPKIVGITWPVPRTLWRKFLMHPVGILYVKLRTKFEVSSWNSFEDISDRLPENVGVTWHYLSHAPIGKNYFCARSAFPRLRYVPNLKSLAQLVLWIVCKNYRGHVT